MRDTSKDEPRARLARSILYGVRTDKFNARDGQSLLWDVCAERDDVVTILGAVALDVEEDLRQGIGDLTHVVLVQRLPSVAVTVAAAEDRTRWPDLTRKLLALGVQFVNAVWADDPPAIEGMATVIEALPLDERRGWAIQTAIILSGVYKDLRLNLAQRAATTMEKNL